MVGAAETGRRLGDFVLGDEIGRGGMGVVYRARQLSADGRLVALKVLSALNGLDSSAVERFRREAEAAGRLDHSGIVPIHALGEQDGVHFFAMDLVDGPSLEALLDAVADRPPDQMLGTLFEESGFDQVFPRFAGSDVSASGTGCRYARSCARLMADVASALAAAHGAGIVHRDLKPSNVLLRSSGRPVLVDFGLARDEASLGITQSGDAVGTPSYMAPEQARGERGVDGRTDVYGLGATLYEMLTLQPPFTGAHPGEVMRRIVEEDPAPVRERNPRVPEDLERIVERCLRKDPRARYQTALEIEADLRRFLAGQPVLARGRPGTQRLRRFVRRHRQAVTLGGAAGLATIGALLLVGVVSHHRAARDGAFALEEARTRLRDGLQVTRAEAAYGRAGAFLAPAEVVRARREHLAQLFDDLYARGLHDELVGYLESAFPTACRAEAWWSELHARAEGRVLVDVRVDPEADVVLRRVGDGANGSEEVVPWTPGITIRPGTWLVEIRGGGAAPVVYRQQFARDISSPLVPMVIDAAEIGPGRVIVSFPGGGQGFVLEPDPVSEADLVRLAAEVTARQQREEILAGSGLGRDAAGSLGAPARNIGWRVARSIAARSGMHVPTRAELALAASHGLGVFAELTAPGLEEVSFPFEIDVRDERVADAGLRLARFVTPEGVPGSREALDRMLDRVVQGAAPVVVEEWAVLSSGDVDWRCRLTGSVAGARSGALVWRVPGFRVVNVAPAADRKDGRVAVAAIADRRGGAVEFGPVDGTDQPSPVAVAGRLRPVEALYVLGAHHRIRLPLRSTSGARCLTRLRLPAHCRVESVDPAPDRRLCGPLGPELVWDRTDDLRHGHATVAFRVDGSLATPWPAFAAGEDALLSLLESPVDEDRPRAPVGSFDPASLQVVDVTAVGTIVSVFAHVDWIGPGARVLRSWPIHATFSRLEEGFHAVSLEPFVAEDGGRFDGGTYRHDGLGVVVQSPANAVARRGARGPWPLQLVLHERAATGDAELRAWVEVRGLARSWPGSRRSRGPGGLRQAALERLAGTATFATGSARIDLERARPGTIGPAEEPQACSIFERDESVPGGRVRRERWFFVERMRGWLLVRCVAEGPSDGQASAEFARAEAALFRPCVDGVSWPADVPAVDLDRDPDSRRR